MGIGTLYTAGGDIATMDNSMAVPQKIRNRIILLGIYSKEMKEGLKDICKPKIIAALFTIANRWKQPKYLSMGDGETKCGVCTQWDVIQP